MAKLTRKQRAALEDIRTNLRRGITCLRLPKHAFCLRGTPATTTLHFTRADGATLYELNRDIGSDLTGFDHALRGLEKLLTDVE